MKKFIFILFLLFPLATEAAQGYKTRFNSFTGKQDYIIDVSSIEAGDVTATGTVTGLIVDIKNIDNSVSGAVTVRDSLQVNGDITSTSTVTGIIVDTQNIENSVGGALTVRDNLTVNGTVTATNFSGTNTGNQDLWLTIASQSGSTTANTTTDVLTINGGGIALSAVSGDTLTVTATEADTLASVTGRGTTTTTSISSTSTVTGAIVDTQYIDYSTGGAVTVRDNLIVDGNITGANVTTGSNPGHTHTSTSISGLDLANDMNAFSSADLLGRLSDETGSGVAVFGTSPTFTTQLTTPKVVSAGDMTIDAVNAAANSTVTITNSNGTYLADLSVERAIIQTAAPADTSYSGTVVSKTAGEALTRGDLVYYKSDGKVWKAKGDATTTIPCIGLVTAAANADAAVTILTEGYFQDATLYNFTTGGQASAAAGLIYVSAATAGLTTQTRPATTGNQVQIVGYAQSADIIYFNPDYTYVEVP